MRDHSPVVSLGVLPLTGRARGRDAVPLGRGGVLLGELKSDSAPSNSLPLLAVTLRLRLFPGRRGRGFVLCATSTVVAPLRVAFSPLLLAKIVDDLLQPLARIGFAVSRRDNTTNRVDAKEFVQVALFIQCLRL